MRALGAAMEDVSSIRCVCLIGSQGHGKTTLAQALVKRFGKQAGPEAELINPSARAADAAVGGTSQVRIHTLLNAKTMIGEDSEEDGASCGSDARSARGRRVKTVLGVVGALTGGLEDVEGFMRRRSTDKNKHRGSYSMPTESRSAEGKDSAPPSMEGSVNNRGKPSMLRGQTNKRPQGPRHSVDRDAYQEVDEDAPSSARVQKSSPAVASDATRPVAEPGGKRPFQSMAREVNTMLHAIGPSIQATSPRAGGRNSSTKPNLGQRASSQQGATLGQDMLQGVAKRSSIAAPKTTSSSSNSRSRPPTVGMRADSPDPHRRGSRFGKADSADGSRRGSRCGQEISSILTSPRQRASGLRIKGNHRSSSRTSQEASEGVKAAQADVEIPQSLLYLLDTPGHADLAAEAATALRLTDAAILVVDLSEGLLSHAEALLRQALHERVRPAVFGSGLDRCIVERKMSAADVEARLRAAVSAVNAVVESIPDELLGDVRIRPEQGLAVFGSASQGWALALPRMASAYAAKFGLDAEDMAKELWNAMADDPDSKVGAIPAWFGGSQAAGTTPRGSSGGMSVIKVVSRVSTAAGEAEQSAHSSVSMKMPEGPAPTSRPRREVVPTRVGAPPANKRRSKTSVLCSLVLEPVIQLLRALTDGDVARASLMLEGLGAAHAAPLPEEEGLSGQQLLCNVMQRWCNAQDVVWEMCQLRLPSPKEAQKYRAEDMYRGLTQDAAAKALRACDAQGPLVGYVSRLLPVFGEGIYALGRVFSGTLQKGSLVKVRSFGEPRSSMGSLSGGGGMPDHVQHSRGVERMALMLGDAAALLPDEFVVPCGNIVAIRGPERNILKAGTISDPGVHVVMAGPRCVQPVVRVTVRPAVPGELPQLVKALRRLSQSDPMAVCTAEEWGEHVIAGAGPRHLASCLATLRDDSMCEIVTGTPGGALCGRQGDCAAIFRETVCGTSERQTCVESPDAEHCFEATASPLGERLCEALDAGSLDQLGPEERSRILADRYGWGQSEGLRLWCFGPQECGVNAVMNTSVGQDHGGPPELSPPPTPATGSAAASAAARRRRMQDSAAAEPDAYGGAVVVACRWATKEGGLCEEPLRGVRFALRGASLPHGAVRRGGGLAVGAARRCLMAAQLGAQPGLQEPSFWVEVLCSEGVAAAARAELEARHAGEISEESVGCGAGVRLQTEMPLVQLLGLDNALADAAGPGVRLQAAFARWAAVPDSAEGDRPSRRDAVVRALRSWRQLREELPSLDFSQPLGSFGGASIAQVLEDDLEDVVVRPTHSSLQAWSAPVR